ncbi:MAG: hypothetical protein MUO76_04700 [Anaerolineaceae bacterium]|nr:hypothetical protein [Anaerolineaceae bacterium]
MVGYNRLTLSPGDASMPERNVLTPEKLPDHTSRPLYQAKEKGHSRVKL